MVQYPGNITRAACAVLISCILASPASAQEAGIKIIVQEGQGAINNIPQRRAKGKRRSAPDRRRGRRVWQGYPGDRKAHGAGGDRYDKGGAPAPDCTRRADEEGHCGADGEGAGVEPCDPGSAATIGAFGQSPQARHIHSSETDTAKSAEDQCRN